VLLNALTKLKDPTLHYNDISHPLRTAKIYILALSTNTKVKVTVIALA